MKVERDVVVECGSGERGPVYQIGPAGLWCGFDVLYPYEQDMVRSLGLEQKRTVHLVMTWEDEK